MPDRGEELLQVRREKLERLKASGIDPYPTQFVRSHTNQEALDRFKAEKTNSESEISVAGRISSVRVMGKVAFLDLIDVSGRLQVQFKKDTLGEKFTLLKNLDLGDFLGVVGPLFETKTKEITVEARDVTILAKSLKPPPEKWHGLRDTEQRYRHREADLIANEEVRNRFVLRSRMVDGIRRFLNAKNFVEVETPILLSIAAGAMAHPFITHHNALNRTLYLRIATELHLKRCVIGGLERVYEIGRIFRNEGLDVRHNPEFTTLESYQAYADYNDVMEMVEQMVSGLAKEVLGTTKSNWGGKQIDFEPPWPRLPLRETLLKNSNIDIEKCSEPAQLAQEMRKLGIEVTQEVSWGRMVDKLLSETIEPTCIQPVFLVDYPKAMSPLAKAKPTDSRYAERFEAFAGGMEIANAFTELNDPIEQRRRFEEQEELRRLHGNEELDRLDEDFLSALEYGMPPTGGLGMGIDRLVMLFTGQTSIREVLLFPHLSWSQSEVVRAVRREIEVMFEVNQVLPNDALNQLKGRLPQEILTRVTDQQLLNYISNPRKT